MPERHHRLVRLPRVRLHRREFLTVAPERRREVGREVSSLTHAEKGFASTLLVHGDQDAAVPIEQS